MSNFLDTYDEGYDSAPESSFYVDTVDYSRIRSHLSGTWPAEMIDYMFDSLKSRYKYLMLPTTAKRAHKAHKYMVCLFGTAPHTADVDRIVISVIKKVKEPVDEIESKFKIAKLNHNLMRESYYQILVTQPEDTEARLKMRIYYLKETGYYRQQMESMIYHQLRDIDRQ